MKRKITYYLLTLFFNTYSVYTQIAWTQKADFPGDARSSCVSFSFDDIACVGTGYDGADFRRSFYAYDPTINLWSQIESLGGEFGEGLERNVASSFTIGTKGYVGTGQNGIAYLKDFWQYDRTTNVWTQKADFGGGPRRSAVGFSLEGYGYITCGQNASGFTNDLWRYDPVGNVWSLKDDFPGSERRLPVAFVAGGRAFVGTGDDGTFTNDFYAYDADSENWFFVSDFAGSPRYGSTAFTFEDKGYVLLGYDTTLNNRNDIWKYDPILDEWEEMENFPAGNRSNAVSFYVDSAAYVGMGYDTVFHNDIWRYGDTAQIIIDTTIAISEPAISSYAISVFPNPFFKNATITINNILITDPVIKIYNADGMEITEKIKIDPVEMHNGNLQYHLQTGYLISGIYYLTVTTDKEKIFVQKMVVLQ